ncbi:hypothetical protein RDI58_015565 [Solanum bulbocastanum]|uniref:Uncharacterized protein n=1 Tax=Solanum bulbocastanum TaxID=147425 RepID=A0AAN8TFU9_SOLBU
MPFFRGLLLSMKKRFSSASAEGGRKSMIVIYRMEDACLRSFLLYATEIVEFPSVTSLPERSTMQ